jgi:hypothetical protein
VQPPQKAIERGEAGLALKDSVEPRRQFAAPARRRIAPIRLQVGIEPYVDGPLLARCWAVF